MADEAIVSQLEALMDVDGYINPEESATDENTEGVTESDVEAMEDQIEEEGEPEAESEEDPEGEPEEEGEPESEPEADQLFDITIGEDEYEVNLEELKTGYLRNEDLINRRTALEQEYEEKHVELEQTQEQLRQELEAAAVFAMGQVRNYSNINWEQLKQQDPEQYGKLRLEALESQEIAQSIIKRRNDIAGMQQKAAQLRHEAKLKAQTALAHELIPEMAADPKAFTQKLVAYGAQIGYTEDEVRGIDDARQLAVLNHARLYAESQVRKKEALDKKVTKELPPVIKPNAPKATNVEASKVRKQLRQRLKTEGSVDAAAAFFLGAGMV